MKLTWRDVNGDFISEDVLFVGPIYVGRAHAAVLGDLSATIYIRPLSGNIPGGWHFDAYKSISTISQAQQWCENECDVLAQNIAHITDEKELLEYFRKEARVYERAGLKQKPN